MFAKEGRSFIFLLGVVLLVPLIFCLFTWEKFETAKLPLLLVLVGLALLFGKEKFRYNRIFVGSLVAFIFFGLSAAVFSADKIYSLLGRDYIWIGLYFFMLWAIFLSLLISYMTKERLGILLKAAVAVGAINAMISILQAYGFAYNFFYNPYQNGYLVRGVGLIGNPNFASMFIAAAVMLGVYFFAEADKPRSKIFYGACSFLMIWSIGLLASRGAVAGLLASLGAAGILLIFSRSNRKKLFYIAAGVILTLLLYLSFAPQLRDYELTNTPNISEANVNQRLNSWAEGWELAKKHPITGVGFGNHDDPHNLFINLLIIGGWPLLVSFLMVFLVPAIALYKKYRHSAITAEDQWLDIILISCLAGLSASAFFNPISVSVWVLAGLLLSALVFRSINLVEWDGQPRKLFKPIGIVLASLAIVFFLSQVFLFAGLKAAAKNDPLSAKKFLNLSKRFNPYSRAVYANLAKLELTEENINKIIEIHPSDKLSYFQVGILQENTKHFDKAVKIDPAFFPGYTLAAYYYFQAGDDRSAFDRIKQSLYVEPNYFPSWIILADIYTRQKNYMGMEYALSQAYKISLSSYELDPTRFTIKHLLEDLKKGQRPDSLPIKIFPEDIYNNFW